MIQNTVHTRAVRNNIRQAITGLPQLLQSGSVDANAIMVRAGLAALGRIRRAFITKARGGTDEAGDKWQSLSPKTIAYSRTRQRGRGGRTKAEKKRNVYPSQALNTKQQDRWWEVYRRQLARYAGDKRHAAAVAWIILKREGATTLVDKYGHRQVEILRDTGLLLNSLSPGIGPGPATPEQVFRIGRGEVVIGTNRKGAKNHHEGIPGRLPQRRLWPEPGRWPASWWRDITSQVVQGVVDIVLRNMQRAP